MLYGKVVSVIEALALQAVGRPPKRPTDGINSLFQLAVGLWNRVVARVISAAVVSDEQGRALADKLGRVYDKAMLIHTVTDRSILGGLVTRVGDKVTDGSLSTKPERLRVDLG